ncbi:unnamed protein product [Linum trigynum]|uniref:Uncharacterized protein n=1 Tax=Linum trigynum TaxID=586398 RepID=A0AAV2CAM4_9ROSI
MPPLSPSVSDRCGPPSAVLVRGASSYCGASAAAIPRSPPIAGRLGRPAATVCGAAHSLTAAAATTSLPCSRAVRVWLARMASVCCFTQVQSRSESRIELMVALIPNDRGE